MKTMYGRQFATMVGKPSTMLATVAGDSSAYWNSMRSALPLVA